MKRLCIFALLVASMVSSAALAGAEVDRPAQIISVTKSQPEPICCYSGTDTPLQSTVWNYDLRVRVGPTLYVVEYDTALNYFPSDLVSGAKVDVHLAHHRMYLETIGGELEATVIGKSRDKSVAY